MLLDDANYRSINERLAELEKDRNKETKDKPIYVRPHISFIRGYWRKQARPRIALKIVQGGKR